MNKEMEEIKEEEKFEKMEGAKKKRGRKPKDYKDKYRLNKEQSKFFIDLSKDKDNLGMVFNLLESTNNKEFGREVSFKDIAIYGISKITPKDIEKIQENTLSEMEKVDRMRAEYNKKNGLNLDMGEFLVKKLSLS